MAETTNSTLQAAAYTAVGTERDRVDLPADLFDGTVNMPVMHQAVKAYLSNQRLGLASAVSIILFLIVLVISLVQRAIVKDRT